MPIPPFTNRILPPFVGSSPTNPGGVSPYEATALEAVNTFGSSGGRKAILRGWLEHRRELRGLGFKRGFQWLDGSFVEQKEPRDLDVVSFHYLPPAVRDIAKFMRDHPEVFDRGRVKARFRLDFFTVGLNETPDLVVDVTAYWFGLFSHRRNDYIWKGMLKVGLEDDEAAALAALDH
jgi:hypothetical protein